MDLIIRCVNGPHREQQWFLGLAGDVVVLRDPAREMIAAYSTLDLGATLVFPNVRKAIRYIHAELADGTQMQFEAREEDLPTLRALMRRRRSVGRRSLRETHKKTVAAILQVASVWVVIFIGLVIYGEIVSSLSAGIVGLAVAIYFFVRCRDEKRLQAWADPGPASQPLMTFTVEESRRPSDGHWVD